VWIHTFRCPLAPVILISNPSGSQSWASLQSEDPLDVALQRSAWLDDAPSRGALSLPAEDSSVYDRPRHPK